MDSIETLLGEMMPDRIPFGVKGSDTQIITPPNIAKEMVNTLPDGIWNSDSTFLDPICKSGIFLYEIYKKLMASDNMITKFPDKKERHFHIINNQLYGISPNKQCHLISMRSVYGQIRENSNIISLNDYNHIMTNIDKEFLINTLKEKFRRVKFDVVIGNPPYNRGGDIDFVNLGFELSNKYTCMITPAKWQTAEADQKIASKMSYGEFRKKLVPHMRHVCFYPDSRDVFDIKQLDGITWFILDKAENSTAIVENKCVRQALFNSSESRSIHNRESLINVGNEIAQFIWKQKLNRYYFSILPKGNHEVYIVDAMCNPGKNIIDTTGKTLLFSPMEIISYNDELKNLSDNAKCIYRSDNKEECESFKSWINSRLVRFMVLINVSGYSGLMSNDSFRFVPAPPSGKFDHIYTDEELYDAFNLPQKYRDVIEAVIKERK